MARRKQSGGMSLADARAYAEKAARAAQKANSDLRETKAISRSLRGLSKINYGNARLNSLRPIARTAGDVAKVLGYGEELQEGGGAGLPQSLRSARAKNQLVNSLASNIKY